MRNFTLYEDSLTIGPSHRPDTTKTRWIPQSRRRDEFRFPVEETAFQKPQNHPN
jgi:hypothetical protein